MSDTEKQGEALEQVSWNGPSAAIWGLTDTLAFVIDQLINFRITKFYKEKAETYKSGLRKSKTVIIFDSGIDR